MKPKRMNVWYKGKCREVIVIVKRPKGNSDDKPITVHKLQQTGR